MYQLRREQIVHTDLKSCWEFFSSPKNLSRITPKEMGFEITSGVPASMYEGQIISYSVRPVLGIKLEWVTEIKSVRKEQYFVDEQRKGPYRLWHHEHFFEETGEGVRMIDVVSYELPFGFLGRLVHRLFVRKKLESIFDYRLQQINQIFG
ncbi:MAG: hypothetical protein EP338_06675 [Bacteroidetes bacterium]|nr:MAG: hypothetical protein EP338_06675 [Bacteroidota bacterium]